MIGGSPIFNYLSDDPQAYLLLLKDYIRPNPDICTPCKIRCCESFIKTASASGLAWNRLSPDGRLRPAHTLLDAQLAALGITATNAFGLDLSEEEVDMVFQPAARRLTIDREWDEIVSSVAAMTAYRGRARPDRYDASKSQHGTDRYALGKKMKHMCWSRFTGYDLVRPRGGQIETWLLNLGQLLSDGAGTFLCSSAASTSTSTDETETETETEKDCTCPIFASLSSRHPDTFTGFEWINLVLSAARKRISPDLLSAWSHPLFTEDLTLSSPYHPLCPGYDCAKDRSWYQTPYGYSRIRRYVHASNAGFQGDICNTDQRDLELSFLFGLDVPTGTHPLDSPDKFPSAENREKFLAMFEDSDSAPWWFHPDHDQTRATFSRQRLAHHLRGSMLTTFIALSNLKLNRPMEGNRGESGVDWITAAAFHFVPSASVSVPGEPHPMKKVVEAAVGKLRQKAREVWQVPVDANKTEGVKPFREGMPRLGSRRRSWGAFEELPRDEEEGAEAESGEVRDGEWEGADGEDMNLYWGPEEFMRTGFELE